VDTLLKGSDCQPLGLDPSGEFFVYQKRKNHA
jgi:hypothetical protein